MKKNLLVFLIFGIFATGLVQAKNLCTKTEKLKDLTDFISYTEINPFQINMKEDEVSEGQKIKTSGLEEIKISFNTTFKNTFTIAPNSEIEIQKKDDEKCGPKIRLIKGKIESEGNHTKTSSCEYEIETNEAYLEPQGTRYSAVSKDLSLALAELNGSTNEEYTVDEGEITVRLKKISSSKNKIKYIRQTKNKNGKISKKIAKVEMSQKSKINLKAKSKMKLVKKGKQKIERVAEIEIIEPGQ